MYLKSLEIQGFKSFANKVEFQFPAGIAMVVGPNGSGKSNVVDALRWILGEQSVKSLRGGKLEDIIFAGSDKRKPVGMAQVAITFDNSTGIFPIEYNEVRIERRVYRSGESEFLINKRQVRLKDIHELFLDTGLGREAYSIISQGKVEEIILAKPEERKFLIEEAAGITKYKVRKVEATKKLKETEQNLLRVKDIIVELESQVEPLKFQSEKAQRFLKLNSSLRKIELSLILRQIEDCQLKVVEHKKSLEELAKVLIDKETAIAQNEAKNEELKLELNQKNEAFYQMQQGAFEAASSLERQETSIQVSKDKEFALEKRCEELVKEIENLRNKLTSLKEEEKVESVKLKDLVSHIQSIQKELKVEEDKLNHLVEAFQSRKVKEEENKNDLIEILNKVANLNNSINRKELEGNNLARRLAENEKESLLSEEGTASLSKNITYLETKAKEIKEIEKVKAEKQQHLEVIQKEKEEQLVHLRKKIRDEQELYHRTNSRLRALRELKEDFEGYQKGVKEILKGNQKGIASLKGVRGVVAEVIKVPKKVELAIEIALGGALQNIITDTDEAAKGAIHYLKENKLGRATFLPLTTVKSSLLKGREELALQMDGVLGSAADLIKYPEEFTPVIRYLLGRILIVENIDKALKVAHKTEHKIKIVTIDGEVLNPGGSLTGGSYFRKDSGLLGRSREIEELTFQREKVKKNLVNQQEEEKNMQNLIEDNKEKLSQVKQEIQNLSFERLSLEKELSSLGLEMKKIEEKLERLSFEKEELIKEIEANKGALKELGEKLKSEKEKEEKLRFNLSQRRSQISEEEGYREEITGRITDLKVNLSALEQQKLGSHKSLEQLRKSIEEFNFALDEKDKELLSKYNEQRELKLQVDQFREEMKTLFQLKTKADEEVAVSRETISELSKLIEEGDKVIKFEFKEIQLLQQKEKDLEVKGARQEAELENYYKRLEEEFEVSHEDALKERIEVVNKKEASKEVKELKEQISALGNVNVNAIEEYTKVSERYEFLSKQYLDLKEAKDSLYRVIKEMNTIMTKRFKEAFSAINEHFSQIFSQLFAGGRAYLELTEAESVLDAGLEIVAQPPGKKPQHLNLLSGGEKALTAIGLLFALLKVRPSPFVVLDEIEASLDEANINRFAQFLKEFSKNSQFIVISHRKGTMAVADVLYGITIDEMGVSKMVSLSLHS